MGISWREWGKSAFEEARRLDRPILLSISAVWCHWCHVMDRTTWSDPEVQELVMRETIPVRVDTDARPDINARYNMGGWPTTVLLTPNGYVLSGGTYFPPEEFKKFLREVVRIYHTRKSEIYSEILQKERRRSEPPPKEDLDAEGRKKRVELVRTALLRSYDMAYGGFGRAPKFPYYEVLEYVLRVGTGEEDARFRGAAEFTLRRMWESELWDAEEGGFFRYATKDDWTAPHYEKLLLDQVEALGLYALAAKTLDRRFAEVCERIYSYLHSVLRLPDGGFGGSQDADEIYYSLPRAERAQRRAPAVDRRFFVGWNARAARELLRAGGWLEYSAWRREAEQILERVLGALKGEQVPHYISEDGSSGIGDLLEDYAFLLEALTEASLWGETREQAVRDLLERMEKLWDADREAYRDIPERPDAEGAEKRARYPLEENMRIARSLHLLAILFGEPAWSERAQALERAFSATFPQWGLLSASYAWTLETLGAPFSLVRAPEKEIPAVEAILGARGRAGRGEKILPCGVGACGEPVEKVEDLRGALQSAEGTGSPRSSSST